MKFISKKERKVGEVNLPKALIMPLFEDEGVKKAIRASVSVAEVIEIVSSAKDKVTQSFSTPYVAQKWQVIMAAALLCSLNLPPKEGWGLRTASSHHMTRAAWLSARNQFELTFSG
eukprot:2054726-Ditylum_brightwellii.AAC.1